METIPNSELQHLNRSEPVIRRATRQRVESLVYAAFGPDNGGFPINVSEDGMAFQGILPLKKDQLLQVKFKLPEMKDTVESTGHVVWVNELGKGGGLRFVELTEQSRDLIRDWIVPENLPSTLNNRAEKSEIQIAPEQVPPASNTQLAVAGTDNEEVVPDLTASCVLTNPSVPEFLTPELVSTPLAVPAALEASDAPAPLDCKLLVATTEEKHVWIKPLSLGLIVSAAAIGLVYTILFMNGRTMPQEPVSENPIQQVEASPVTVPVLPLGSPVADLTPPIAETVPVNPKQIAPANSPVRPAARVNVIPPKPSRNRIAMFAKSVAPNPYTPARINDVAPPAPAPQFLSEQSPRLPEVFSAATAPTPALLTPTAGSVKTIGNLVPPQLVSRIEPAYPDFARTSRISGPVELHFTIKQDGKVRNVVVTKGNTMLGRAAVQAVQRWRFTPARRDGVAVEAESSTVVMFSLP